jgi:hypothetical protein
MPLSLKQLTKRAKEYVELEANTKVTRVTFAERFYMLGQEDVVLLVTTTDKRHHSWWVVGGSTPMNLYSKSHFASADEAFSMHMGLMLRMGVDDFEQSKTAPDEIGYDAFISYASEDKTSLVKPLAHAIERKGYRIWFDEFELKVGDSLRESIDLGLVNSRYGIVILSKAFFAKRWTQYELDGLSAKEIGGRKVILPVWHNISRNQILAFSPTLADKVAVVTSGKKISQIATALAKALVD